MMVAGPVPWPTYEVTVRPVIEGKPDSHGNPERTYGDPVTISNVLRAPNAPTETSLQGDVHGRRIDETWYLPECDFDLFTEGAEATCDGATWRVFGPATVFPVSPLMWRGYVNVARRV